MGEKSLGFATLRNEEAVIYMLVMNDHAFGKRIRIDRERERERESACESENE